MFLLASICLGTIGLKIQISELLCNRLVSLKTIEATGGELRLKCIPHFKWSVHVESPNLLINIHLSFFFPFMKAAFLRSQTDSGRETGGEWEG